MKFIKQTDKGITYLIPHFEQTITVICGGIALAVPVPDEEWPAVKAGDREACRRMFPAIVDAWNAMPFGKLIPMTINGRGFPDVSWHRVDIRVLTKPLEMSGMQISKPVGTAPAA